MGYAGGTVTQPIIGGFDELGKLLLQGQSQVNAIVLEVEKRRTNEVNQLAKMAGEISATGIEGYDKIIQNMASAYANSLADAHEANRRGDISLGEVSRIRSKLMKNTQLLANQSKIHDENMKAIYDGVNSEELSPISIDAQNALWFSDPNMKNNVFLAPALDSQGNPKTDSQGNPITIMRKAEEAVSMKLIDNDTYVVKSKEVQKIGPDGNPLTKDGYPVTETKTWTVNALDFLSPSRKQTRKYNLVDEVSDFNKTLGKRVAVVDKTTGAKTEMPYEKLFETPGTMLYGYTIAEEDLSDIVGRVERTLDGLTDENYISILHDYMGAKAEWQPDFKSARDLDVVNSEEELNYTVRVAGQSVKIPKYYDEMGNAIGDFTYDPLVLQTGQDAKIHLDDKQRSIAKGFVRDAMLKSLNVTQKEFKDHINGVRKTKEEDIDVTLATHSIVKGNTVKTNAPAGYDYLKGIASIASIANMGINETSVGQLGKARSQFNSTGAVSLNPAMDLELDNFIKLANVAENNAMGQIKGVNLSSDVKKVVDEDFKATSTSGQDLENISQVFLVSQEGEIPRLAFIGDTVIAETVEKYQNQAGGGDVAGTGIQTNTKNQVVAKGISLADSGKAAQFYRLMYNRNPEFKQIVEDAGFKGLSANSEVFGNNAIFDALKTYFNLKQ